MCLEIGFPFIANDNVKGEEKTISSRGKCTDITPVYNSLTTLLEINPKSKTGIRKYT